MESTGTAGVIHVSEDTQRLAAPHMPPGCGRWLRREGVEVKGKGTMDTYWLLPQGHEADRGTPGETTPTRHRRASELSHSSPGSQPRTAHFQTKPPPPDQKPSGWAPPESPFHRSLSDSYCDGDGSSCTIAAVSGPGT